MLSLRLFTHLAVCGPTLVMLCEELAFMSSSFMAPDSIPRAAPHSSVKEKKEHPFNK